MMRFATAAAVSILGAAVPVWAAGATDLGLVLWAASGAYGVVIGLGAVVRARAALRSGRLSPASAGAAALSPAARGADLSPAGRAAEGPAITAGVGQAAGVAAGAAAFSPAGSGAPVRVAASPRAGGAGAAVVAATASLRSAAALAQTGEAAGAEGRAGGERGVVRVPANLADPLTLRAPEPAAR
ncbi:hypothetical protein GCM10028789_14290 [Sinomonas halotolerans]